VRSAVSDVSWSSKQAGSTTVGGLPSAVHDDGGCGKVVKPKADYNITRAGSGGGAGEEKIKKMYARAACGMCFSCTL